MASCSYFSSLWTPGVDLNHHYQILSLKSELEDKKQRVADKVATCVHECPGVTSFTKIRGSTHINGLD